MGTVYFYDSHIHRETEAQTNQPRSLSPALFLVFEVGSHVAQAEEDVELTSSSLCFPSAETISKQFTVSAAAFPWPPACGCPPQVPAPSSVLTWVSQLWN